MNALHGLLLPLLLTHAPAAPSPAGQEISWHPEPGSRLRREIVTQHFLTAESQNFDNPGGQAVSQRLFEMKSTQRLTVTDVIEELAQGRPLKLRRFYDDSGFEVNIESSMGAQRTRDKTFKGTGSVVGRGVLFTWIPEDEEYGRYYHKKPGIEEVLPGLTEDLGMRGLMPSKAVELGDSWKLSPGVLRSVFNCGGDVDFELSGGVGFDMLRMMRLGIGLDIDQPFGGTEEGEVSATLMAVSEEDDGRRLAEIYLEFDVVLQRDLQNRAQEGMTMHELRQGWRVESSLVTMELEGSGNVRWDLGAGRLHDTTGLKASQRVGYKLLQARETPKEPEVRSQELIMIGTLLHEVRVQAVEQ